MSKSSEKKRKSIEFDGQKYILASSLLAEERLRVLKHEDAFGIFDRFGQIYSSEAGEEGIYYKGTRFLSLLDFSLGKVQPLLLSSAITQNNILFSVDFTNSDFSDEDGQLIPRGSIHILRSIFLNENSCFEKIQIKNFLPKPVNLPIGFEFAADFKDIFEVRGTTRTQRGVIHLSNWSDTNVKLSYTGLDDVERATLISFAAPQERTIFSEENRLIFQLKASQDVQTLYFCYEFYTGSDTKNIPQSNTSLKDRFDEALAAREKNFAQFKTTDCRVTTSNEQFNNWLSRSYSDIQMMNTPTPHGLYPFAGVPWFSTTFGRDGLITALQTLWINPDITRGVLSFLAHTQAKDFSDINDAEPGKILHEARDGEMAALGEIPFGKYYGSIDSTPLFIILSGEYFRFTGDRPFIESLWPSIAAALNWIDKHGDSDGDGFVEYSRRTNRGLINQGWKDSHDSVFHRDGTLARPPIALCELQGYVYQAKINAAYICTSLGKTEMAEDLYEQAYDLKKRFHEKFWSEKIGTFALALDGEKNKCEVRSSNVGHCLFSGIINDDIANQVADGLMNDKSFCGWGIRTIAEGEANFNPMSYHNGSVWPHDTSIIAAGLARYGRRESAMRLLAGLFDASIFLDLNRLPELFCGFIKQPSQGPTLYPVSCAPQAWAAGAVFLLLKACLGFSVEANKRRILFDAPILPVSLKRISICNLRVADACVDLEIVRHPNDIGVNVTRREGQVSVVVNK